MTSTDEQIVYLAQQAGAMQTDVAELQNALQGSEQRNEEPMVQLVTSESSVKRVVEAGDKAITVMSRLQALKTRDTGTTTSTTRTHHTCGVASRAVSRSQHSKRNCRTWMENAGHMLNFGQIAEYNFKDIGRRLWQVLFVYTTGEATSYFFTILKVQD